MAQTQPTGEQRSRRASAGRPERRRQAKLHAEQARQKVDRRREQQSGAAGWVADRAGDWTLAGPDYEFMDRQKFFWNWLMDYWFRMEIEGWEHLPEPPVLLVGSTPGRPSSGTPGRSACSGGDASVASARSTAPPTTP